MNPLTRSYLGYARGERKYSPWFFILKPLGWTGSLFVWARRALYDHGICSSEETPLTVVSVGNLTTGGTNKTPFVEFIAKYFLDAGIKPGIISRGYGGKTHEPVVIVNGNADRGVVGDEPLLLSGHLPGVPVAVSRDRLADVKALLNHDVEVVVADDAFQHRRLAREVDIVLVDPFCPFGNGSPLPCGILRELPSSLARAHIVVISKADQVPQETLDALSAKLTRWVPEEKIFYSRLGSPAWAAWDGRGFISCDGAKGRRLLVFSAIGSPRSFHSTVEKSGAHILFETQFKDHHHYCATDLKALEEKALKIGAEALCCTEKDIFNLPCGYKPSLPLLVPRITSQVDEPERFWGMLTEALKPRFVVASNGNGEDAIGARLALKVQEAFPCAEVEAFPLVGQGDPYKNCGIPIDAPLVNSPTGGIIKYHFSDLVREIRSGLLRHIGNQLREWKKLRRRCSTVLCVGDAYLLCHTLWGQGKKPLLVATAKTQFISGHWKLESFIYKTVCKKVWTRDEATAEELRRRGVNARFEGNPIMDLLCDNTNEKNCWGEGRRILVLPGSRSRAYHDLTMLLSTLELISREHKISAVLVVALSLDPEKLVKSASGWRYDGSRLSRGDLDVVVYRGEVATVAPGAELLLGLAGTANQVCAGMGIPVLSVKEKGKFVQKKLLGGAELLVEPNPEDLAKAAVDLLRDPARLAAMGEIGRARLGVSGSLDAVVRYAERELGWKKKCVLYEKLRELVS